MPPGSAVLTRRSQAGHAVAVIDTPSLGLKMRMAATGHKRPFDGSLAQRLVSGVKRPFNGALVPRSGKSGQKLPQACSIGALIPEECVVMGTANRE